VSPFNYLLILLVNIIALAEVKIKYEVSEWVLGVAK